MRAIRLERHGGPEVLVPVEVETPRPGPGQILLRHEAVGLNFIDVYRRTGLYPAELPLVIGNEAAGVIEAVGEGVTRFAPGDRAAYGTVSGAYAEFSVAPEGRVVKLPPTISTRTAAAVMLKGMTAEFLTRRVWPLAAGDWALVHAAAGGVGTLLTQWLAHLGVRAIGTVGSEEKAAHARAHGRAETILYRSEDVAARVRTITGGAGVRVAYDSVGRDTFEASLASLGKRGLLVSYGAASGPVEPLSPLELMRRGSLFLTRPTLFDYVATTEELDAAAAALFQVIESGAVKIEIGQTFPLAEAAEAHRALESRSTTGATLLIP